MKKLKEAYIAGSKKIFEQKCELLKNAGIEFETKIYKREIFSFRDGESGSDYGLYYIYVDKKDLGAAKDILRCFIE